ncbi:MAG TPA: Bax inhibitor-1/YccA family protein [Phycisphaerae bacterium]|nr:Bax inhibitor-1/YccA family protein [Phycisphaerae bacterium]
MTNFDPQAITQSAEFQEELAIQRTFMARVFGWMTIGLLVTALTALAFAEVPALHNAVFNNPGVAIGLLITYFVVGLGFGFLFRSVPSPVAAAMFVVYSVVTGIVLSTVFLVYTSASIYGTFFITAGMFGTMAFIGYTTKRDLSSLGMILFMALIGLFLASIVNIFLHSSGLYWLISLAGVAIFTGLTAYDVQRIKQSYASGQFGSRAFTNSAIFGAFMLYLDFINLFMYLLRFLGNRRD